MIPQKVYEHLNSYWQRSKDAFKSKDYPIAAFFAITLIEEIGKIVILGKEKIEAKLDKKAFRDHRKKYIYAVYSAILVNSRITRIYGDFESKFAFWFKEKRLFSIRNSALYLEKVGKKITIPLEAVSKQDAFLLVCIAGEVLAEIQGDFTGSGPKEWRYFINQVDVFRKTFGKECGLNSE